MRAPTLIIWLWPLACLDPAESGFVHEAARTIVVGPYDHAEEIVIGPAVVGGGANPISASLSSATLYGLIYPWEPEQLGLTPGPVELRRPPCAPGTRTLPIPDEFVKLDASSGEVLERSPTAPFEVQAACLVAPTVPTCFDHRELGDPCFVRRIPDDQPWCGLACAEPPEPLPVDPPEPPRPVVPPNLGCDPSTDECVPATLDCATVGAAFLGDLRCRLDGITCAGHYAANLPVGAIHVDPNALPGGDGTFGSPLRTINEAISVAPEGSVIALSEGTHLYTEGDTIRLPAGAVVLGACLGGTRIATNSSVNGLGLESPNFEMRDLSFDTEIDFDVDRAIVRQARIDATGHKFGIWIVHGDVELDDVGVFGGWEAAIRVTAGARGELHGVVTSPRLGPTDVRTAIQVFDASLEVDRLLGLGPIKTGIHTVGSQFVASHLLFPSLEESGVRIDTASSATVADTSLSSLQGDVLFAQSSSLTARRVRLEVSGGPGLALRSITSIVSGEDWTLAGDYQQIQAESSTLSLSGLDRAGPGAAIVLHGPGAARLEDVHIRGTEHCPEDLRAILVNEQGLELHRASISNVSGILFQREMNKPNPVNRSTIVASDLDFEADPSCVGSGSLESDRQLGIRGEVPIQGSLERIRMTGFTSPTIEVAYGGSHLTIRNFHVIGLPVVTKTNVIGLHLAGAGSSFALERGLLEGEFFQGILISQRARATVEDLRYRLAPRMGTQFALQIEDNANATIDRFRIDGGAYSIFLKPGTGGVLGRLVLSRGMIEHSSLAISSPEAIAPVDLVQVLLRNNVCDIVDPTGGSRGCGP